jgi:hypothetical protein
VPRPRLRELSEPGDRGRAAVDAELRVRLLEVFGDGRRRDPQLVGDICVGKPLGDECEDLALPGGQARVGRLL